MPPFCIYRGHARFGETKMIGTKETGLFSGELFLFSKRVFCEAAIGASQSSSSELPKTDDGEIFRRANHGPLHQD
jgi:hypothetical protein